MNKFVLSLLALGLAVGIALVFWFTLDDRSERGARAEAAVAPTSAPAGGTLAAPSAVELAPTTKLDNAAPAVSAPLAVQQEQRTAADGSGRVLKGHVLAPGGAPGDDTLRVLALDEPLTPELFYGTGGLLQQDSAEGKKHLLASAAVDAAGNFTLALGTDVDLWLALDGHFLYSARMQRVAAGESTVALACELGGALAGQVHLPAGTGDEAAAFAELTLDLGPDGQNFTLGGAGGQPMHRSTKVDAQGHFELHALPCGKAHELSVDAKQCADAKFPGLEFEPGRVRALEVVLVRGATLRGVVHDEHGQGVAGAKVRAAATQIFGFAGDQLAATDSDASGAFALEHIAPGKCQLLAKMEGFLESEGQKLELRDEETREGFTVVLTLGAALAGRAVFEGGEPAAGAAIEASFDPAAMMGMGALNAARGGSAKGTAGADGRFELHGLGKGPFVVNAKLERDVTTGAEKQSWRAKQAGVKPDTRDIELTLAAPCDLAGTVMDGAGKPIEEFSVHAQAPSSVYFAPGDARDEKFKDPAGAFVVHGLTPGVWKISASAKTYGPLAALDVTLPQSGEPLVLVLAPAATISGTVVDPAGTPVAGAKVTLQSSMTDRIQRLRGVLDVPETLSNDEGAFVLNGVAGGSNSIFAGKDKFANSEPAVVEVRAGERAEGVVLKLRKGAIVTGEVYGNDGKLAAGVKVLAQDQAAGEMSMQNADAAGAFRFESLSPGSWTITAILDQKEADTKDDANATTASFLENLKFDMVQLIDGDEKHVVLGAPPKDPVVVHGQVKHGKETVATGLVSFYAEGSKGLGSIKMAALGAEGHYEVKLDKAGRYLASVQINSAGGAFQQHNVEFRETIPETKDHKLDFELPLGGVRGMLRDGDKKPLVNGRVTLVTDDGVEIGTMLGGQYSETTSDETGHYAFDYLRPGNYAVAAGGALFGGAFGTQSNAGRMVRSGLHVVEGKTLENVDFELEEPGDIGGRVTDGTGAPIKDAALFVRDANGHLLDRLSMIASGPDGSFQYTGVAPGEYMVSARGKGQVSAESAAVRVRSGEKANVEIVLYPGTKLVIEVVDDDDKPLDARLSVLDGRGREMQGMMGMAEMASGMSEGFANSKQTVGPLPPGTYTVTAVAADGKKASKSVNLDGQAERRLKLRVR